MSGARALRGENPEVFQTRAFRSASQSSDAFSLSGRSITSSMPAVNPKAAYIAQAAAEQLVSQELDGPVTVSEAALELANGFLDQVLFSLLSTSKSTSLDILRTAVPKLLRPRLGQAALSIAEEELHDYLEDEDLAGLQAIDGAVQSTADFDVELSWKLVRLKCMMYARLGNMEEEDEHEYLEQERLEEHAQNPQFAIAPTTALFLTSVIEFLGEQALCTAAQHAERRFRTTAITGEDGQALGNVVLEVPDMLQLGRDGPLSRLWRSWRRETRAAEGSSSRPETPGFILSPNLASTPHSRKDSYSSPGAVIAEEAVEAVPSLPNLPPIQTEATEPHPKTTSPTEMAGSGQQQQVNSSAMQDSQRSANMMVLSTAFPDPPMRSSFRLSRSEQGPAQTMNSGDEPNVADSPFETPSKASNYGMNTIEDMSKNPGTQQLSQHSPERQFDDSPTFSRGESGDRRASKGGRVGGTVAAIAGALGAELRKSSYSNKNEDPRHMYPGNFAMDGSSSSQAEAGVGQRSPNNIPSPVTVNTGSPPSQTSQMRQSSTGNAIDGEKLNSRSARTQQAGHQMSGLGVTSNVTGLAPYTDQSTPQFAPSMPKRTNREAAIYQDSGPSKFTNDGHSHPSEPSISRTVYQAVTKPSTYTIRSTPAPRVLPWDDEPSDSRPSAYSTVVPVRGSSLEPRQPTLSSLDIAQGPSMSRFSEYSTVTQFSTDSHPVWYSDEANSRQRSSSPPQNPNMSETTTMIRPSNTHTANSSIDQRPDTAHSSSTAKRQHLRLRTETEESINNMAHETPNKSFDSLIHSGETLHYTLTPESARAPELPRTPKAKTQTQDLVDFLRTTAPPGQEVENVPSSKLSKSSSIALRPNTSETSPQNRVHLGQPRDPRAERGTTRDLADYARSTGPEVASQLPQVLSPRPGTAPGTKPSPASKHDNFPKLMTGQSVESTRPATAADKPTNRLKFQARDARPARTNESSDLIDFIREGPPRAVGEHRIDRHVAPFRTTQDSEDLLAIAPKIDASPRINGSPRLDVNRRSSTGSAQESSRTAKSMQESTDSRTALLDTNARGGMRSTNGAALISGGPSRQVPDSGWQRSKSDQYEQPQRKRGKVRDPYAIDFSDDEYDEEPVIPQTKPRDEESLIDFLRNTGPTPGMAAQPVVAAAPHQGEKAELSRSSSMSKMKELVSRDGSGSLRNGHGRKSCRSEAREESPHLTQVGSKLDKYRPTQATHAAHVERNRQKPRNDGRDGTRTNGDTTDLADFLRNTEPPDIALSREPKYVNNNVKEQAGFLKFFSKRGSVRR